MSKKPEFGRAIYARSTLRDMIEEPLADYYDLDAIEQQVAEPYKGTALKVWKNLTDDDLLDIILAAEKVTGKAYLVIATQINVNLSPHSQNPKVTATILKAELCETLSEALPTARRYVSDYFGEKILKGRNKEKGFTYLLARLYHTALILEKDPKTGQITLPPILEKDDMDDISGDRVASLKATNLRLIEQAITD